MENINFEELRDNLIDVVKECQMKIGYTDSAMSLYYPAAAVCRFLNKDIPEEELTGRLEGLNALAESQLGKIRFKKEGEKIRFTIPKEGTAYVHENVPDSPFLKDYIESTLQPGCTLDKILEVFNRYSDKVVCRPMDNEEFDYLVYFEDGKPDSYRYCLEFEFGRAVYHRFTPKEYEALGLE